jgi:hypothetical protein
LRDNCGSAVLGRAIAVGVDGPRGIDVPS